MKSKTQIHIPLSTRKVLVDAYDRIVVKMHLQKQQQDRSVFLICGTDPKVGATSAAVYLSSGLAKSGRKVLLLDADMRKAADKKLFGQEAEQTLAKYLTSENMEIEDIIYGSDVPGLDVIAGGVSADPVQILCAARMRMAVNMLRDRYDFIIINIPSAGAAADSNAVLGYVDQVVMVAAPDRSYKKQIIESYEDFSKYGVSLLGVIVNRVDCYGYHDYTKNGNYYTEEVPSGFWGRLFSKKKQKSKTETEKKPKPKTEIKKEKKK